jgi:hypothetical protein
VLNFIGRGNFVTTAGASVNVDSIFTGKFRDYLVLVECTCSTASNVYVRLRKAGVDATTNYRNRVTANDSTLSANTSTGQFQHTMGNESGAGSYQFNRPAVTGITIWRCDFVASDTGGGGWSSVGGGIHTTSDTYDGFSIIPSASYVLSGRWTAYGIAAD